MPESPVAMDSLPQIGGHVALDLANTAGWHESPARDRNEHLLDYADVVQWAARGGLDPATARALLVRARRDPDAARRALATVREWREVIYRVFADVAAQRAPAADDLTALHRGRMRALAAAEPHWSGSALTLEWPGAREELVSPAYPALLAAVDLLGSEESAKVRQCGNHPCGWLFIDRTKNGSRRWCSSAECGNVTRVRRFRARN